MNTKSDVAGEVTLRFTDQVEVYLRFFVKALFALVVLTFITSLAVQAGFGLSSFVSHPLAGLIQSTSIFLGVLPVFLGLLLLRPILFFFQWLILPTQRKSAAYLINANRIAVTFADGVRTEMPWRSLRLTLNSRRILSFRSVGSRKPMILPLRAFAPEDRATVSHYALTQTSGPPPRPGLFSKKRPLP